MEEQYAQNGSPGTFRCKMLSDGANYFMDKSDKNVARMVESIIGCKWSLSVIHLIRNGINRPGAMQRQVDGLTTKVLNERLNKLLRFGIVDKIVYPESPPRVEYRFTEFGQRFLDIVDTVERVQGDLDRENVNRNDDAG